MFIKSNYGIVQGMCGSPMIQQQSTVHKDVTQRLIRKQQTAPNCQFLSSMFFDKEKHNTFKNEEFLKFRKWHLWNGKLFQVAKIISRNRDK